MKNKNKQQTTKKIDEGFFLVMFSSEPSALWRCFGVSNFWPGLLCVSIFHENMFDTFHKMGMCV